MNTWTKKEWKEYKKMCKRQRAELVKMAKKFRTFDWGFMHEIVVLMLTQMLEYYKLGVNIYQVDSSKNDIIKSLEQALNYNTKYKSVYNTGIIPKSLDEFLQELNTSRSEAIKEKEERKKKLESLEEQQNKYFENFYRYLGKHMREWWD